MPFLGRVMGNLHNTYINGTQIMQRRMPFNSTEHPLHQSAGVQQLWSINLYVDNCCTKEQLQIRHSQRHLFQESVKELLFC
jgi:hypothetical protein